VWSKAEIDELLGADAALFCQCFDVTEKGNWEHTNILHVAVDLESFAKEKGIERKVLDQTLDDCLATLLQHRNTRVRPLLDDKMLLGWNALMNTACSKAFAATGNKHYRQLAIDNMDFVLQRFIDNQGFFHTYKNGVARYPAFLDDYAFLIQALIGLQEVTGDSAYLVRAKELTEYVIANFCDTETGFFYFTHKDQPDIIVRKKEVYDGAIPSGNATMSGNLQYLSFVFDYNPWREHAGDLLASMSSVMLRHPTSFGVWANQFMERATGIREIVVTGENFEAVHFDILHNFMPARILQFSAYPVEDFPLLAGKEFTHPHLVYLCENYVCRPPVTNLSGLIQQLENDKPG